MNETAPLFVARLSKVDRGDLATLKRNAGATIGESRNAVGLFYRILPPEIAGTADEEVFFLVASLFGHNEFAMSGDFGVTMRRVREVTNSASVDQRFGVLLDGQLGLVDGVRPGGGELAYRLRQCVKLAAGHSVGVDWPALLADLTRWSDPGKRVQKRWARSYYSGSSQGKDADGAADAPSEGEEDSDAD